MTRALLVQATIRKSTYTPNEPFVAIGRVLRRNPRADRDDQLATNDIGQVQVT